MASECSRPRCSRTRSRRACTPSGRCGPGSCRGHSRRTRGSWVPAELFRGCILWPTERQSRKTIREDTQGNRRHFPSHTSQDRDKCPPGRATQHSRPRRNTSPLCKACTIASHSGLGKFQRHTFRTRPFLHVVARFHERMECGPPRQLCRMSQPGTQDIHLRLTKTIMKHRSIGQLNTAAGRSHRQRNTIRSYNSCMRFPRHCTGTSLLCNRCIHPHRCSAVRSPGYTQWAPTHQLSKRSRLGTQCNRLRSSSPPIRRS